MNSIVIGAATSGAATYGAATHRKPCFKLAFEGCVFDEDRRELTRGAEAISVGPQVFDLLAYLLQNREHVVSKDDLIETVWGGRIVSESTLTSHINAVRKAIGDTGEEQRLLRTIARKGYRFVGEVRELDGSKNSDLATPADATPQSTALSIEQSPAHVAAHSAASALACPDRPSIAVLPFTNMSGDPEQAYFSDGITEDLITELSRFRSLFVIARKSSFQFRETVDMKRVGRELGVQYLVEGSVRRAGNRVRVTAQLIDARTGNHLWAERFDRDLADIFSVQDEVTARIVTSIRPVLAAESLRMAKRKPPEDMQAYDCLLKAKELLATARTSEELREARTLCDHALRIDPTFARAHSLRSMSFTLGIVTLEADDLSEWRRQALISAERAVASDAMDGINHLALAWGSFLMVHRDRTLAHCSKAISLNPNDADILVDAAFFYACYGQADRAVQHLEAARERNSSLAYYDWASGCVFYLLGRYSDAMAAFEEFVEPNESIHLWRAACLIKLGRHAEAQAEMQVVRRLKPGLTVGLALEVFRHLPVCDDFVGTLRRAGLPECF